MMICYYKVLEIERNATDKDIKLAYRKKALQEHPDKNPSRIEEATKKFAEIQQAYEILSDPNERSWYDAHREKIINGWSGEGGSETYGLDSDSLLRYFSVNCFSGYNNDPNGFYCVYSSIFEEIEKEEDEAFRMSDQSEEPFLPWTSMGKSHHKYLDLSIKIGDVSLTVQDFYNKWIGFSSIRTFSFCDKYRMNEAPDRKVKRLMEKENKKLREAKRKEFNETVRNLALFCRKRDPRYKNHLAEIKTSQIIKENEIKERLKKEKEEKTLIMNEFIEQDWQRIDQVFEDELFPKKEAESEEHSSVYSDSLYCAVCDKLFKSQKQYDNHSNSKKHLKLVELFREEMKNEKYENNDNVFNINIDDEFENQEIIIESLDEMSIKDDSIKPRKKKNKQKKLVIIESDSETLKFQFKSVHLTSDNDELIKKPKKSKKKTKPNTTVKENVLTNKESEISNLDIKSEEKILKCLECSEMFETRNQLFNHIKILNHHSYK